MTLRARVLVNRSARRWVLTCHAADVVADAARDAEPVVDIVLNSRVVDQSSISSSMLGWLCVVSIVDAVGGDGHRERR